MTAHFPEITKEALLFLVTAGLIVPLFRRVRISPVIGFLCAGFILGPHGLGTIARHVPALRIFALDNVSTIEPIADLGVVFLLFMIGLELSWERLTRLRRLVFGLGALQLGTAGVSLGLGTMAFGASAAAAAIIGPALALSSTAVIIPVMAERKRLATAAGRTVFSVLLFQDLMVAPLLFLVTMMGVRNTGSLWVTLATTLVPAICGVLLVLGGGRLLIRPLFHHVVAAGSTEFFMAACLLVIVGTGILTALSGLSMGLGAFIAGLLLAETEYRREIEVTIEPFKGLLLGLFFVAIGAGLDASQIVDHPLPTVGLAAALVAVKVALAYGSARVMKLPRRNAIETALMLAPGGEFAFVLIAGAVGENLLRRSAAADIDVAVTLSLFCVPLLAKLASRLTRQPPSSELPLTSPRANSSSGKKAILIGYGRVGRLVGAMLSKHGLAYLAVDENVATVRSYRRDGIDIVWGNATRLEFLERCGLGEAAALIVTLDVADATEHIVRDVRARFPMLPIIARARDADRAARLYKLGATDAVPETIEASLQLTEATLVDLGIPMGVVIASIHEKRDEYRRMLQPLAGKAEERHAIKQRLDIKALARRDARVRQEVRAQRAEALTVPAASSRGNEQD